MKENQSFYNELKDKWDMHSEGDLVISLGDLDGHIGRHIDRFIGVHGGYSIGQRDWMFVCLVL